MPELPEVDFFMKYLESTSLHKTISEVIVRSNEVLEDVGETELENMLASKEFLSSKRHGKYLFANVSGEFWLVMHFGMTGNLKYFKDLADDPKHGRLLISFDNGYHLAYDCQRKFGKIAVTPKIEEFIDKKRLGQDALELDFQGFKEVMQKRRGGVKSTLLNQHVIAGIGNLYSDEIVFQAGVHPETKINRLGSQKLEDLFNDMQRVLKTALRNHANFGRFPESYLLRDRREGAKCPRCGGKIQALKVSGRTAYFCSNHQKLS